MAESRDASRADPDALQLRAEHQHDADAVRELHALAFPTRAEAQLVDRLRNDAAGCASLVACEHQRLVGHVLFSNAQLLFESRAVPIGALGPIAVLPARQRSGIGAALIRAGLERCAELDLPAVIVLGNPHYYGRFGFRRADTWGIRCELTVPPEAFMIKWLAAPEHGPALAKYNPAFSQLVDD